MALDIGPCPLETGEEQPVDQISASHPQNPLADGIGGGEQREILVLGDDHRPLVSRARPDRSIVGIPQADVPERHRVMAFVAEPSGKRGRQLGVYDEPQAGYSAAMTTGCPSCATA